jgi:hypothetical protein
MSIASTYDPSENTMRAQTNVTAHTHRTLLIPILFVPTGACICIKGLLNNCQSKVTAVIIIKMTNQNIKNY